MCRQSNARHMLSHADPTPQVARKTYEPYGGTPRRGRGQVREGKPKVRVEAVEAEEAMGQGSESKIILRS